MNAALLFLKALDPKVWLYAGLAVAMLVVAGAIYHAGGNSARADYKMLVAQTAAEAAKAQALDQRKARESRDLIAALEKRHAEDAAANRAGFAAELKRVRNNAGGGGAREPARINPEICADAGENRRLSDALFSAQRDLIAALVEYQVGVGDLLEVAGEQALDLVELKAFVVGERKLQGAQ